MEKYIKDMLEDIYMIDESLRKHDKELVKMAEKLLAGRPDTHFSQDFADELKTVLLKKADELKGVKENSGGFSFKFDYRLAYALGGAVLTVLLMIPIITSLNSKSVSQSTSDKVSMNIGVTQLGAGAFGDIFATPDESNALAPVAEEAMGLGGGVGFARTQAGGGGDIAADGAEGKMIAPDIIEYEFVYEGEEFSLEGNSKNVYRRVKEGDSGKALANYVTNLDMDIVDLTKFKNSTLSSFSLNEDRKFGYSLNFNFDDNSFSIYQVRSKWPRPDQSCRDEACYERYRFQIDDVPTDDRVIKIANDFAAEYGIDLSHYGEPTVRNEWRVYYNQVEDKRMAYVPDELSVVYPLIIDGQPVYDQSGYTDGINVSVDIRNMKGAGVNQVYPYNFESSEYQVVNDADRLLTVAEQGGMNRYYAYEGANKRTVKVSLGTPQIGLMKYWKYYEDKGSSEELYVPAMIFPVTDVSDNEVYYQKYIMVPLVEEMLNELTSQAGYPRPMPLIEPAMGSDAAVDSMEVNQSESEASMPISEEDGPETDAQVKGAEEVATPEEPAEIKTRIRFSE